MTPQCYELDYVRQSLRIAIQILQMRDKQLLTNAAHELSVTHRLATYIELFFAGMHVDCDYNRNNKQPKRVEGELRRPDIIIHRRQTQRENLLAIEVKIVSGKPHVDQEDSIKLNKLKETFNYRYTASISISSTKAMIHWEDGSEEEISYE